VSNPIPVIIGVGQVNDRESCGSASLGLDSLGLMEAALRAADTMPEAAGYRRWILWESLIRFPGRSWATCRRRWRCGLGASPRFCYKSAYGSGDSPLLLLNEAANRIGAGEIKSRAVAGGRGTAHRRSARGDGGA